MQEWCGSGTNPGYCEEFLAEFLRAEGRGSSPPNVCPTCEDVKEKCWDSTPLIHCKECGVGLLECIHCSVRCHQSMPLHRIKVCIVSALQIPCHLLTEVQRWMGTYFEPDTLKACSLRIQLGHWNSHCISPRVAATDFTVLHVNGIHKVAVDFCGCQFCVPDRIQCLRYGWYPATTRFLWTCASMTVLKHFHMQTLCGKVSVYEYYQGLTHLMDNTKINMPKVRQLVQGCLLRCISHLFSLDEVSFFLSDGMSVSPFVVDEACWTGAYT